MRALGRHSRDSACLNATALVAAIGKGQGFARALDLSAWLGARIPTADDRRAAPEGITNRGNVYLSKLLIYGACCHD